MAGSLMQISWKILKLFLFIPLTIIIHLFLILLVILFLPFLIWRRLIFNIAKIFKPKLGKMLTLLSGSMYIPKDNPIASEIVSDTEIEGENFDLEIYKKDFQEKIINLKNPNGELTY